jgi:Domain of unknown function (DUF5600)
MKTNNLAPGDFPEIQSFATKLNDVKFSDFANFSQRQIDDLDVVLNVEIPKLMSVRTSFYFPLCLLRVCVANATDVTFYPLQELPSEKDSPESLRAKMNEAHISVPIPSTGGKFGKAAATNESNPFGFAESDESHFWYVPTLTVMTLLFYVLRLTK